MTDPRRRRETARETPEARAEVVGDFEALRCMRCGFPVRSRPWGCKNPCGNCGFVYPLGDCSD